MLSGFQKKETHIILEELDSPYVYTDDSLFRFTVFSVDEDNNIRIKKDEFFDDFEYFAGSGIFGESIVLALNAGKAKTIEASFSIKRYNPNVPMSEGELDHLMFKALWEFLNRHRNWSFTQLGISDLDMVLAGIEVTDTKIDTHSVVHPLGVKGKLLNVKLRGTFVPRSVLPIIKIAGDMGKHYSVVERLSAVSAIIGEGDTVIYPEGDHTSVYSRENDEVKFVESRPWGINPIIDEISQMFFSSPKEALMIFNMYCLKEVSPRLKSAINKKIKGRFETFFDIMKPVIENHKTKVNIPKFIYPHLVGKTKGIERVDFVKVLEDKGFHVKINGDARNLYIDMHSEPLALLALSLFAPKYEVMNSNLHRRASWLMATGK